MDVEKVIKDLKEVKHEVKVGTASRMINESTNAIDNAIWTIKELQGKSEEVCEWKYTKEIMDNAEFKVGCNTNALKRGVVPNNFSYHNFKYCPYCGKKIKVVE